MHCERCGRLNRQDAAFCDACGAKLAPPEGEAAANAAVPEATAGVPRHSASSHAPESLADGVFVGRQAEMGVLQAALEDALAGRGRLVMLVGEPGIGKTRTAREFLIHAGRRGALGVWGRCHESPGAPPYWPWVQIIRAYVREHDRTRVRDTMGAGAPDIAAIAPEVQERLSDLSLPPRFEDPEQARFRLFDAVTTFLQRAAHDQPLVLVLDDLHWADKSSLLLLEFLAQELGSARLLVIGTYRAMEVSRQHPLYETLAELTRERPFQRVMLGGLGREDVGRFLEATAGIIPPLALVEAVHAQTEGNPLFLTEVIRLLAQEGELAPERVQQRQREALRIPEGIRQVIGRRLNRLSPPCNRALTVASVFGREFALEELRLLLPDAGEDRLLELLEEAVAARVIEELPQAVGHYQFTHALIRATLYDELTGTRRARLHRSIGEVIEELYRANLEPNLAQLAHHFFEADGRDAADKAIAYAARAGGRALSLLAYEEAVHHYGRALQALERKAMPDEVQRCKLLVALGEAQRKAGDVPQAMATFQRAADLARSLGLPQDLAQAALGFEETTWRPGLPGGAAALLLEEAFRALGEGDSLLKARVLGSRARALAFTGATDAAEAVEAQAVAMARRIGDPTTLAAALKARFYTRWRPEQIRLRLGAATELIGLAEAADEPEAALNGHGWRLFDLMELGDVEGADRELAVQTHLAEELRQPFYQYISVTFRAMRAVFAGRFAEGQQLAQEALAIGQRLRGQDALGLFGVQMFTLRREQGRLQEVAPLVKSFVQRYPKTSTWRPGLAVIYSELELEQEARAEFELLAAHDFADIPRDARWVMCMAYLAEVCAFLGDARRAATLYCFLTPHDGYNLLVGPTAACFGAAARYLGLLAATMRRWEEAQRHFEDALAMNARMGAKPWLAHTHYAYAAMLLARGHAGDYERAMSLLDEALSLGRDLGMRALEARVVGLQRHATPLPRSRRTYSCGLTPREVEVLQLMASGKSNHDIAEALFVSPNTVANHVRSILTKTNTANRTEAAAYALRHGLLEA
jgi:DNA-binding CsgD family transcriptional regulator